MVNTLQTCIWIKSDVSEAANFYKSVFPSLQILSNENFSSDDSPHSAQVVEMEILGQQIMIMNGGPAEFELNESVSLVINCDGQDEVDVYWDKLISDGGQPSQCGWLKDKYGMSWQVVPRQLMELVTSEDVEIKTKAFNNMLEMTKIEIDKLLV